LSDVCACVCVALFDTKTELGSTAPPLQKLPHPVTVEIASCNAENLLINQKCHDALSMFYRPGLFDNLTHSFYFFLFANFDSYY
jgi:hypothetical protein